MKFYQKLLSGSLSVLLTAQMVLPAFSAVTETEKPGQFLLTDAEGNTQIVDESWEETFPSGTFAFSADQINLQEGDEGGAVNSITLYRLGGTDGRAEAYITMSPAAAPIDDAGTMSYANAAGTQDYRVSVELPWTIAQYQPLGGTPDPIYPSEYVLATDISRFRAEDNSYPYYIAGLESADSYQWQVQESLSDEEGGKWLDVAGATDALFYVTTEYEFTYHAIRCMYTVDGKTYCTETNWGEAYIPEVTEEVPEIPEDFVNDMTERFYDVEFDGDEYDMYTFPVIFADGEWEKTITFEALDDDLSEATEVILLQITEAYGASLYDSARVANVAIADNEPQIPSQIGFAVSEVYADKSAGTVRIPLERTTDGLQYVVGAVYSVADGTAVVGTDYSAHEESSTYFPADMDMTYLEIDLIDNGVELSEDETGLYFTVTLTEVQGSAGSGILPGQESVKVYLYNTSAEKPESGNIATELYSDEEEDASAAVTETIPLIGKSETIYAEAAEIPENAVGDYIPNVSGLARTYDYGALTFANANGGNYWDDYAEVAYNPNNFNNYAGTKVSNPAFYVQSEVDRHEGYSTNIDLWNISGSSESGNRGLRGRWYTTQRGGHMELPISNMYEKYREMHLVYRFNTETGGTALLQDGSNLYFSHTDSDTWIQIASKGYGIDSERNSIDTTSESERIYFWSDYKGEGLTDDDATSWVQLDVAYLERRTMPAPNVVIHTADDDLIRKTFPELHDTIKPEISMVAGKGGVTDSGDFYNGSRIEVSRGLNASSYQFAAKSNGGLDGAVFFSDADQSKTYKSATPKDGKANLDLLMPADDAEAGTKSAINVVMDRIQNIAIQIAPSVERQEGLTNINPEKIGDAWNTFLQRSGGENSSSDPEITYTYSAADFNFQNGDDGFELREDRALANASTNPFTNGGENGSTLYTAKDLKNVREINFNLPEDDLIVFNGRSYKGNETIQIPVELYTSNTLVFYYYHKDFVTALNDMVTTIMEVHRYIDINDNGKAEPEVDYLLESLNDGSYTITDLTPRKGEDGKYHQIVLQVFYTMLPKCLVLPEGAKDTDTAEVIPALVTSQTGSALAKLSDEQQGYRYIDHKGTGDGKPMYGAEATAKNSVDIPLGGDFKPAVFNEAAGEFTWTPDWQGNSYYVGQFADAEPVYIDNTVFGDRYPIGEVNTDGELTADGANVVEQYLTSVQENDTFSLCVRPSATNSSEEPQEPLTRMSRAAAADTVITGLESATLSGVRTYPSADSARNMTDPYADDPNSKNAGFDSSAAGSDMPEYNMTGQQTLPALDIGLTDYVSIEMDGQNLAFTIGLPLGSFSKSTKVEDQADRPWQPSEKHAVRGSNSDSINMVKSIFQTLKNKGTTPAGTDSPGKQIKDSFDDYKKALQDGQTSAKGLSSNKGRGNFGIKVAGVEGSLGLSISIVLKWNPLESQFHFNQLLVVLAGSIQFSYTARLTPCPIFYVSVTVGAGVELKLGLEASRVKKIAEEFKLDEDGWEVGKESTFELLHVREDWEYFPSAEKLGGENCEELGDGDFWAGAPGSQFTITTKEKAIDIHFNGKLYVDAVAADGSRPEGFTPGTISSDGEKDEQATIKLAKKVDGKDNAAAYIVTFTVLDDGEKKDVTIYDEDNRRVTRVFDKGYALIDRAMTLEKNVSDVYFSGVNISPELFFELCVGVGVEMFKVELFFQVSVGCSFALRAHDSEDYAGEEDKNMNFAFNEFSFAAALGFRVTALFFNFEFEAVKFLISYDRQAKYDEQSQNKRGWNFFWYAANKQQDGGHLGRMALTEEEPDNPLTIRVILPGEGPKDETIYSPEDNLTAMNPLTRAYSAPEVPFEFSGYSDSGYAFPLEETLLSGSTYKLVTAGDANYLVYTVNNSEASSINATQLVISKVQETAQTNVDGKPSYGLVSLTEPENGNKKYDKLDTDNTGDLEFDAWAVGDDIRAAWVSYTDAALDAYNAQLNPDDDPETADGDEIKALAEAGKHTVVKSVTIDIESETVTIPADSEAETEEKVQTTFTYTIGNPEQVSPAEESHGMYFAPSGAGDLIYYSEAQYYADEDLTDYLEEVKSYLGGEDLQYSETTDYVYGESDPTVEFQMYYRRFRAEVYGKTSYPTYALRTTGEDANGVPTVLYNIVKKQSDEWAENQVQIENVAVAQIGDDYYAAYNTAYSDVISVTVTTDGQQVTTQEERTSRKLYLQRLDVDENDVLTIGTPVVIRALVDHTVDSEMDGVYAGTVKKESYDDPYFANVNFLTGKLGELSAEAEPFEETLTLTQRARDGEETEPMTFLIFEMNAETYVVPERSLVSITTDPGSEGKRMGEVIPFFTKETAEELNEAYQEALARGEERNIVESAPAVTNVTFGVDGNGNVTAVYTQPVRGTTSNALYMTKFDSTAKTWGAGTMLAMHRMSVYEDSVAYDWTLEDTEAAFYTPDTDGQVRNFNFSKISIGFAGPDQLLVITEGTLANLTASTVMEPVRDADTGKLTGITQQTDENSQVVQRYELALTDEGVYNTKNGIYALTFGVGERALGYAALHLSNYDFTPGSTMNASVSFTNIGDMPIRASSNQPAVIRLMMEYPGAGEETVKEPLPGGEWLVTESIAAGQKVETIFTEVTLPVVNITEGERESNPFAGGKIYFTVEEDGAYSGSEPLSTEADKDTAACITIEKRVEMGYEHFEIEMADAAEDTVTLSANIHVGNRGTKNSQNTYLRFQYTREEKDADGDPVVVPYALDLTNHKLSVSDQAPLTREVTDYTLANGYLPLRTTEDGKAVDENGETNIDSMHGRTVTGTFTVDKDCYDTDIGTGSLNLVVTIVSVDDNGTENEEYDILGNIREVSIEPETLFEAPAKLSMQIGSTFRMPIDIRTSTLTDPKITVTEEANDGERNLSVLYYDTTHSAIVIMPGLEGEGIIRVADEGTGSIYDICYSVNGEGEAINIYNDNEIFEWYVPDADGGLKEDDPENPAWEFPDMQLQFANGLETMPYRSDLSVGKDGYAIKFRTLADTIEFFFMGDSAGDPVRITVESDLDGFDDAVVLTSSDGTVGQKVEFHNAASIAHTVTVTVEDGSVRFDKMYETFADSLTLTVGDTPPIITFSRTLPEAASIPAGTTVPLKVYFADIGGLASVMIDGETITADKLVQESDSLWSYDLTDVLTDNGSHWITAADTSGSYTEKEVNVEWFSSTDIDEADRDPGALQLKAVLVDKDGNPLPDSELAPSEAFFMVTDENNDPVTEIHSVSRLEYLYDDSGTPTKQYMQTYPVDPAESEKGMYRVPSNGSLILSGIYQITYTDPTTGIVSECFAYIRTYDITAPEITGFDFSDDGETITINITKDPNSPGDKPINSVTINDWEPEGGEYSNGNYSYTNTIDAPDVNGTFVLEVTDENGSVTTETLVITDNVLTVPEDSIIVTPASLDAEGVLQEDGAVMVEADEITGGLYDPETSTGWDDLNPRYEIGIAESGKEPAEWKEVHTNTTTPEDVVFSGLEVGKYDVHIRDANDPKTVIVKTVEIYQYDVKIESYEVKNSIIDLPLGKISDIGTSGGEGTIQYRLLKDNDDRDEIYGWQDENSFGTLSAGFYIVEIRDSNNHDNTDISEPIEIKEFAQVAFEDITYEHSINEHDTGWIDVRGSDGEGNVQYRLVDEDGHVIFDWQDNGLFENLPAGSYIVEIEDTLHPENRKVSTAIVIEQLYTVEISVTENGHAEINGTESEGLYYFREGEKLTIRAVPMTGYYVSEWFVNGEAVSDPEADYVIESLDRSYVIEIAFRYGFNEVKRALAYYETIGKYQIKHYITAEAGEGGSISPEGKTVVYYGDSMTYTITPDDGYAVDKLMVNGKRVPAAESYTFEEITGSAEITVTFREEITERPADTEPTAMPEPRWDNPFADVSETSPYYDAVRYVFENGYMNGVSDSAFAPDTTLTRAMLVTILWRMAGSPAINCMMDFSDVPQDTWYTEAVRWAAGSELVLGYGDGTFGPEDKITVEQLAVILYRYIRKTGGGFTNESEWMYDLPQADAAEISDWAREAMHWFVSGGIYTGTDGYLEPQEFATRALAAHMLYAMSLQ